MILRRSLTTKLLPFIQRNFTSSSKLNHLKKKPGNNEVRKHPYLGREAFQVYKFPRSILILVYLHVPFSIGVSGVLFYGQFIDDTNFGLKKNEEYLKPFMFTVAFIQISVALFIQRHAPSKILVNNLTNPEKYTILVPKIYNPMAFSSTTISAQSMNKGRLLLSHKRKYFLIFPEFFYSPLYYNKLLFR